MINRALLWIAVVASLGWIGYVAMDILSEDNNYTPEQLFGEADQKLLIINRASEVAIDQLPDFAISPISDIVRSFNPDAYATGYVSASQNHLLLHAEMNWTPTSVQALFGKDSADVVVEAGSFKFGEYQGRYYKRDLYMSAGEILKNEQAAAPFKFDRKASASVVHFPDENNPLSVSDIYFKTDGRVDYITYNADLKQGNQVKDEILFSGVVTANFDTYHFYERDYYASLDSIFAAGPMAKWMLNGFLDLDYDGSRVLICDYIGGQDPLLILNDLKQTLDKTNFGIRLTKDFPSAGKTYEVNYLEDLVVFSESKAICDKVVADFKLGNTIALNKATRQKVYGDLPQSVSERIVTKELSYSKAVYRGKLLETQMGVHRAVVAPKEDKASIALICGFDIADFAPLKSEGSVVALGKKGEIARFVNGKSEWTSDLKAPTMGDIQLIDLYDNGENFILLNTEDEIHLWNLSGSYVSGFPVKLDESATNEVKFYRWKGSSYFLIANVQNEVIHLDSKGRELNVIKSSIPITRQIDVWASQSKLFAGFANDRSFIMYNMDRKRVHREFPLVTPCLSLKVPNELYQFGLKDNQLVKIDQKGVRFDFPAYDRAKILGLQMESKPASIIVQSANTIHLLNAQGIAYCDISLPFNEVDHVFIETTDSGKTIIAIIDGLENNVYLYGLDGTLLTHKPIEGQTKVHIGSEGNTNTITTVVDQYIVQYFE